MNQFDFSALPEQFHFYCVDSQGNQWVCQKRPIKVTFGWSFVPVSEHDAGYKPLPGTVNEAGWEESLRQRPVTVEWLQSIGFAVNGLEPLFYETGNSCCYPVRNEHFFVFINPGKESEIVGIRDDSDGTVIIVSSFTDNGNITRERILNLLAAFGHEK